MEGSSLLEEETVSLLTQTEWGIMETPHEQTLGTRKAVSGLRVCTGIHAMYSAHTPEHDSAMIRLDPDIAALSPSTPKMTHGETPVERPRVGTTLV